MIKYNEQGLIPVIVQDIYTKDVLMLAYMNEATLAETKSSGYATYYSRSRQARWQKGETSGHVQKVKNISYDCDKDTILLQVEQVGNACHTGSWSCFIESNVKDLYETIAERKVNPVTDSYTNYLFSSGLDKILKKVGEEAAEVMIAAKNEDVIELTKELSDLYYHTLVLMVEKGITKRDVMNVLKERSKKE